MLATTLLPHQSACIERILEIKRTEQEEGPSGVVVSLSWGAGKTLTSIEAALAIAAQRTERLPIFVLTDVSTVEDWMKNAQEHYSPPLSVTFVSGKARVGTSASIMNWHILSQQDIIVANIEILVGFCAAAHARRRQLIERALADPHLSVERNNALRLFLASGAESLSRLIPDAELAKQETCTPTTDARFALFYTHWPVIIIDEAHKVRNSESGWFSVMSQLRDDFRISLTATPFNNSIKDVMSVLAVSNVCPPSRRARRRFPSIIEEWNDALEHPREFCADFVAARDRYIVQGSDGATVDRQHYRPVDIILRVPFATETERERYRELASQERGNMLKQAVRLKQSCAGVFEEEIVPTKIKAVLAYLEVTAARCEKVNIMCEYRTSLEQLRKYIAAHFGGKLFIYTVDGSTSAKDRQSIRIMYERHRGPAVLIVTSIFNQGVNLHCANHTILFSTQWNPVVADQSRSRCERPAQVRSVFSVQIVIADTIEDQIWAVAATKRKTNQEVMCGDITPELLQRVDEQDEERTPIDEQLRRSAATSAIASMMRESCTHLVESIDDVATTVPPTVRIAAIASATRPALKRMAHVGVVVDGRVVVRRVQ